MVGNMVLRREEVALRIRYNKFIAGALMAAISDGCSAFVLPQQTLPTADMWAESVEAVMEDILQFWPEYTDELLMVLRECQQNEEYAYVYSMMAPHMARFLLDQHNPSLDTVSNKQLTDWVRTHLTAREHQLGYGASC